MSHAVRNHIGNSSYSTIGFVDRSVEQALAAIAAVLPFQAVYFVPMSIYVGAYEGSLENALLSQAAWAVGLFLAARLCWARVQRRITIQGG